MSVIVSNGDTSLATASGFYRAEAYNVGSFSATALSLTTSARTIAVTFANAGNLQGIILGIQLAASATRSITVKLQKNVASVWTDVTIANGFAANVTKTLTVSDMTDGVAAGNTVADGWIVPFVFPTPFAIDTVAATWRFYVSQSAGSQDNYVLTSDATNLFFVAWCDNAMTFTDNDCVVAKDKVTIDKTATFKGVLGTGDTTRGVAAIACKTSTTADPDNVANFIWQNAPVSAYTLTVDGVFVLSSHGGFRAGTSTNRIPVAQQGIISFVAPSVGTLSGFTVPKDPAAATNRKCSLFIYGEIPAYERTTLNADAATGQKVIVTNDSTGWAANDYVFVGKQNVKGQGDTTLYQIDTVVGTTITLKTNLATNVRKAGGAVVRTNGYGFKLTGPSSGTTPIHRMNAPSNFVLSGVELRNNNYFGMNGSSGFINADDAANTTQWLISHCSWYNGGGGYILNSTNYCYVAPSMKIEYFNVLLAMIWVNQTGAYATIDHCAFLSHGTAQGASSAHAQTWTNNVFENGVNGINLVPTFPLIFTGNSFWGYSTAGVLLSGPASGTWGSNRFNNCAYALNIGTNTTNLYSLSDTFADEAANTYGITMTYNGVNIFAQAEFANPQGTPGVNAASNVYLTPGSLVRVSSYAGVAGDDRGYMREGVFQRCGAGLSDTTAYISGGSSLRFEPNPTPAANADGQELMHWTQTVPTGNIQDKPMTVVIAVKINNAAYYGGTTYTRPTLTVTYDVTTQISAVAAANAAWQLLTVTFTPTTTTPTIDMDVSGASDATAPNTRFYVGLVQINFPPGTVFDLGSMAFWAHALPVTPSIATFPSLAGIWDEATAAHGAAGSYGLLVKTDLDATISSRSTLDAAGVWAYATRTLSSFGSLVSDIVTAVWGAATRTLSAFGFSVTASSVTDKTGYSISGTKQTLDALNDITADSVWAVSVRTLSSFGSLVSDIATAVWGAATRTLSAFGFDVTVGTNNDKTGYTVSTNQDKAGYSVDSVNDKTGYGLAPDQSAVTVGIVDALGADVAAAIYDQVLAALRAGTLTEPGAGAPPANPTPEQALMYLYAAWKNKVVTTKTETTIYADDGTPMAKAAWSDNGNVAVKGKVGAIE